MTETAIPVNEYRDASGRPIQVGDYLTYSVSTHAQAELRFGRVLNLKRSTRRHRPTEPKLGIVAVKRKWEQIPDRSWRQRPTDHWELVRDGKETTFSIFNGALKITADQIPAEALELLEPAIP